MRHAEGAIGETFRAMPLRPFAGHLMVAGLVAGLAGPAIAQSCVQSAERTAFEVTAMKSQLMVVALICNRHDDYASFVNRFRSDLLAADTALQGHFRRGSGGRRDYDAFITTLANVHGQDQIRQGSQFCSNAAALFPAALAQGSRADLAQLVADRNVMNPMTAPNCPATPARATPAARSGSSTTRR